MKRQASAVNLLWPIKEDWAKERETMVTSRRDGLCENWLEGKKETTNCEGGEGYDLVA